MVQAKRKPIKRTDKEVPLWVAPDRERRIYAHARNRGCRIIAPCWERKCRSDLSFQHDFGCSRDVHPQPYAESLIQRLRRTNALSASRLANRRQSDAARIV